MSEIRAGQRLRDEAETLAAGLPPLLVEAERLAATVALGVHGRKKAGMGESFWQFRRYRPEDEANAIDWRQSARSQHLFVREREWEAAQAVWFFRDGSPRMDYASGNTSKKTRADLLALALATLLIRGGERIGILGSARASSSSRIALRRMSNELETATAEMPPHLGRAQHAEIVWLSDFLSPLEDIEAMIKEMSGEGLSGHLVHIADPAEADFPFTGRVRFEAMDTREKETLGRAESVSEAYRARFAAHGEAVANLARRNGWSCLFHRTDKAPAPALIALYAMLAGDRPT